MQVLKYYLFIVVAFFSNTIAQETVPELITDRPDVTESASIIYPGWLQIETGFSLFQNNYPEGENINDISTYNLAGTLLRLGLSESVELRAGGSYKILSSNGFGTNSDISGISDLLIGTKVSLLKDDSNQSKFSVLFHLFLPFGKRSFRSNTVEPQVILSSWTDIGDIFSLSYNAGGRWNFDEKLSNYILSLSAGFNIINNLNGYAEIFSEYSNILIPSYFFNGGFTYLTAENIQLDLSAGFGVLNESSSWFASTGITARIPR